MKRPSLEEAYVTAWKIIAPGAEPPQVVIKKWPRGMVHQITTPGGTTVCLTTDPFIKRLHALRDAAAIIEQQTPQGIAAHAVSIPCAGRQPPSSEP